MCVLDLVRPHFRLAPPRPRLVLGVEVGVGLLACLLPALVPKDSQGGEESCLRCDESSISCSRRSNATLDTGAWRRVVSIASHPFVARLFNNLTHARIGHPRMQHEQPAFVALGVTCFPTACRPAVSAHVQHTERTTATPPQGSEPGSSFLFLPPSRLGPSRRISPRRVDMSPVHAVGHQHEDDTRCRTGSASKSRSVLRLIHWVDGEGETDHHVKPATWWKERMS